MILAHPPAGLSEADFHRIEEAVAETARGRWFLAEFARRLRAQDIGRVLDALARLEAAGGAQARLAAGEQAAGCAERLIDIAWSLRERGFDDDVCRALEREASAIHALGGAEAPLGPALAKPVASPTTIDEAPGSGSIDDLPLNERLLLFS